MEAEIAAALQAEHREDLTSLPTRASILRDSINAECSTHSGFDSLSINQ